ncbi:hypothetical protein ES705_12976 [subsurface metagenome]
MISKPISVNQEARRAVRGCGQSRAALCRAARIDQGNLSAFLSGRRGLAVATLDRLAKALDMKLVLRRNRPKKRKAS